VTSFSLASQRSFSERVRWRTWRGCGQSACEHVEDSFRRWFAAGLQDNITLNCSIQLGLYRPTAEAWWHEGLYSSPSHQTWWLLCCCNC